MRLSLKNAAHRCRAPHNPGKTRALLGSWVFDQRRAGPPSSRIHRKGGDVCATRALEEALDPIEARVIPAAGMMTAGAGVAGVAAYATAVAPWASPVTVPVGAAAAAMAVEGVDYLVTGQLSLANWAASHF